MHEELEAKLVKDFPLIYGQRETTHEGQQSFVVSFECGDGWFSILYNISAGFQTMLNEKKLTKVSVQQVKQKFGELRYYCIYDIAECDKATEATIEQEARAILAFADASTQICETCGMPGKIRSDSGWLSTACDVHWKNK